MSLTVINDWHLGAIRSGGTTPATAAQLRADLLANAEEILYGINDSDLLVNGDLFDAADIPKADLLRAVQLFNDWLARTGRRLFAADGNHDLDKNSTRLSAFQLFVALLVEMHGPERVVHIAEHGTYIDKYDAYVIPHVANQELFDLELENVPACTYLFVHANYDNGFATESDHSLNLSKEQAERLPVEHIVFGHEHQQKFALGHKVVLVGNQFPSSISDCLGNSVKKLARITSEGLDFTTTWSAEGDYSEQDWRELEDRGRFIRVSGTATAAEADKVVSAIARFRREAKALVITNAVRVEGVTDVAEAALSHEEITKFNVMDALLEILGPEDGAKIKKLMEEENAG